MDLVKTPLFIHIPKNGGMTIRRAPHIQCNVAIAKFHINLDYTNRLNEKMNILGDHPGHEHARLRDINPNVLRQSKPFAIIRNPWDRVVSRFFFAKKVIEIEKKVPTSYADVSSFEAFLEERHKWGAEEFMWHRAVRGWYPALDHVLSHDKKTIGCDILRFENYDEDTKRYFNLLSPLSPRNITNLNKEHYSSIYTPETINIVGDWYKDDIDMFGYDFKTGPTKNFMYVNR